MPNSDARTATANAPAPASQSISSTSTVEVLNKSHAQSFRTVCVRAIRNRCYFKIGTLQNIALFLGQPRARRKRKRKFDFLLEMEAPSGEILYKLRVRKKATFYILKTRLLKKLYPTKTESELIVEQLYYRFFRHDSEIPDKSTVEKERLKEGDAITVLRVPADYLVLEKFYKEVQGMFWKKSKNRYGKRCSRCLFVYRFLITTIIF